MEGEEKAVGKQGVKEAGTDEEVIELLGSKRAMTEAPEEATIAFDVETLEDFFFASLLICFCFLPRTLVQFCKNLINYQ